MNGIHDCGGMDGFGAVAPTRNEPVFSSEWEGRVFALDGAITAFGCCSVDEMRHAIERMDPAEYIASTYYERWIAGFLILLSEKGIVSEDELRGGAAHPYSGPSLHRLAPGEVECYATRRRSHRSDIPVEARFGPGDSVRVRRINPKGHTRLPRYVRGCRGTVLHDHGVFVFPDVLAHGQPDRPQHLYTVRFSSDEVWGVHAEAATEVVLDLYEDYICAI